MYNLVVFQHIHRTVEAPQRLAPFTVYAKDPLTGIAPVSEGWRAQH